MKPLKHSDEVSGFYREVQEWRGGFERIDRPWGRSKALKGEAQERWELKEASEEMGAQGRRAGSQTRG